MPRHHHGRIHHNSRIFEGQCKGINLTFIWKLDGWKLINDEYWTLGNSCIFFSLFWWMTKESEWEMNDFIKMRCYVIFWIMWSGTNSGSHNNKSNLLCFKINRFQIEMHRIGSSQSQIYPWQRMWMHQTGTMRIGYMLYLMYHRQRHVCLN